MIIRPLPIRLTNSADLAAAVSDETGTGALVFANGPTLIAPILGVATATTINALTLASQSIGFTIAGGTTSKTLTVDETIAISAKAPLASPVFTTQITTPQIVTASGNLTITPAGNANIVLQGSGTGNVGIGQPVPTVKLDILGAAINLRNPGGATDFYFGQGAGSDEYAILHWDAAGNFVSLYNQANINALVIKDGNVGIGTTGPTAAKLVIEGTGATKAFFGDATLANDATSYLGIGRTWASNDAGYISYTPSATVGLSRLDFGHFGQNNLMVIQNNGNVGIGTPTPTAVVHLKAGTAAANTAPFKMTTSGTGIIGLLTTPEKGAMEFSDYGLWFTPATARHKIWAGLIGATAPGTAAIGTIADYFGTSATRVLTTPNTWISVVGDNGATYKVPAYS